MTDINTHKNQLTEMLSEITAQLKTLGIQDPDNKKDWITAQSDITEADENVVADRTEEYDTNRAILAELERQYNDIVRALAKIESGTYGICEVSGEKIEEDRLNANPAARTCKAHLEAEKDLTL